MLRCLYLFVLIFLTASAQCQLLIRKAGLAGGGGGYFGNGGPATTAAINNPYDVAVSRSGNFYIADYINHVIRKVDTAGIITTVAGNHTMGYSGDGGPATAARIKFPWAVAVDTNEAIYLADDNNTIRKVNPGGIITTFAGHAGAPLGDGGPATAASLYNPVSVALDGKGNVYIADGGNGRIRKVNTVGIITTVVGHGVTGYTGDGGPATAAGIQDPRNIKFDRAGNMYFADYGNMAVRKVDTFGIITTVAGRGPGYGGYAGDGGPATAAKLRGPDGVAVDKFGNIYISDYMNGTIRKVDTSGTITSLFPMFGATAGGIDVDTSGNLYIAAIFDNKVDEMVFNCIPSAINGIDSLCTGTTALLTNVAGGGIWAVANTKAAVSSSGNVIGLAAGYDTVTYTTHNICGNNTVSKRLLIQSPLTVAAITGQDSLCIAGSTSLSDISTGGLWSVVNDYASISATGYITGISRGLDTVVYSLSNVCGSVHTSKTIVINPFPFVGVLTGIDSVCLESTVRFSDSVSGGVWTVSNSRASVSEGLVTGLTAGIDTVIYTLTTMCGSSIEKKIIHINQLPDAGSISGISSLCQGTVITLTATVEQGKWISENPDIATIDSTIGALHAVSIGIVNISYTVSNSCGSVSAFLTETITDPPAIAGDSLLCPDAQVALRNAEANGVWTIADVTVAAIDSLTGVVTGLLPGTTTAYYTTSPGCQVSFSLTIDSCVVTKVEKNEILPNPVTGTFTVYSADIIAGIKVWSINGQCLMKRDGNNTKQMQIDFSEFAAGMYFISINNSSMLKFTKL